MILNPIPSQMSSMFWHTRKNKKTKNELNKMEKR